MRVRYTAILIPQLTGLLKERFSLPEPPTDAEMAQELAGLERLTDALGSMETEA